MYMLKEVRLPVVSSPNIGLSPNQDPLAKQESAFSDSQVSMAVVLYPIVIGPSSLFALMSTLGGNGCLTLTVTLSAAYPPGPVQLIVYV